MLKHYCLFLVTILVFTTTVFSQTISTEELNKRVLKDSATYSWEQVNEIVNGLENEVRLDTAYSRLSRENINLTGAYVSLEKRFINYKDTIVPAYQEIIKEKEANFNDLNTVYDSSEKLLKKQKFKKWIWIAVGALTGYFIGSVL